MSRVGKYVTKPFSKTRQNIVLLLEEGSRKHSAHALIEVDVTKARKLIHDYREKTGESLSFTGWIARCVAQAVSEHKELNTYRLGRRKLVIFDDVDIAIPVERTVGGEPRPMAYVMRRVNEKNVKEITDEIRAVQREEVDESTQVLGKNLTPLERFALNAPLFIKKLLLWILRRNGLLKKKHMGTIGVTSVGMKGRFPGWALPIGGITATLIAVGGITEKPRVVNNKIENREILHMTVTVDHDVVDGGPLARFVARLTELMENGFDLVDL